MSENTKTLANTGAISQHKAQAAQFLPTIQAAFTAMQTTAANLTFAAFKEFLSGHNFEESAIRRLIVATNLGNTTPTIGGVAVDIKLLEQSAVIANLADIRAALVEIDRQPNFYRELSFYVENSGTISVDNNAIETAYTRTLSGAAYAYYAAVKSIVDSLKTFNETYNRKGLWLFENHVDITNFGDTISLKEDTF